jgi:ribosomal protein S18 acetylase RimI-like enzyme
VVRRAERGDAFEIAELCRQLGHPATTEQIEDRLEAIGGSRDEAVLVALDEDGIAGWIQVRESTPLQAGARAEILGLVVDEARRRRGIGELLVESASEWAGHRGLSRIVVRTNVLRSEAPEFYRALGFEDVKQQFILQKAVPLPEGARG